MTARTRTNDKALATFSARPAECGASANFKLRLHP